MGLVRVLYILCTGDYLVSILQPKGMRKLHPISVNRFYSRKLFFLSLKTPMTSAAEAFLKSRPSASSGRLVLMKGLDIFSSPIVDGTVGWWFATCSFAQASFSLTRGLEGSTDCANDRFVTVYSWPQNTRAWSGSCARVLLSETSISAASPSKNFPQPATMRVSPEKTAGCSV